MKNTAIVAASCCPLFSTFRSWTVVAWWALLLTTNPAAAAQEPADPAAEAPPAADSGIPAELRTVAESSGFRATCTTAECDALMERISKIDGAGQVRLFDFGATEKGHPLKALAFGKKDDAAWPNPALPPADDRIVVLVIGNIHSGECDGKEALLAFARDLALDPADPRFEKLALVIAPNYNADGNDDMAPDNRRGQLGPELGMGKRANSKGLDLNRDFVKLESAEGRSLVGLINSLDPHIFIDCHTTDGSRHRYPMTYDIPHNPASPGPIRGFLADEFMPDATRRMAAMDVASFYYGNFNRERTRWENDIYQPRFSTDYAGMRGRLGILAESYSYVTYEERIKASRAMVTACVDAAAERAAAIRELVELVDQQWVEIASDLPGRFDVPLEAQPAPLPNKVTIATYADDSDEPEDVEVEYWAEFKPTAKTSLPWAYLFDSSHSGALELLQRHGIKVERLNEPLQADVTFQTIESIRRIPAGYQGPATIRLQTNSGRELRRVPEGTLVVRTAQPLGRLAVWLLEAQSLDGLVTWGNFGDAIQQDAEFPVLRLEEKTELKLEPAGPTPAAPDSR